MKNQRLCLPPESKTSGLHYTANMDKIPAKIHINISTFNLAILDYCEMCQMMLVESYPFSEVTVLFDSTLSSSETAHK